MQRIPSFRFRLWHAAAALVLATLTAASGCQKNDATAVAATEGASSGAKPAAASDPRQVLDEMVARYRQAASYEDAGELHFMAQQAGEPTQEPPALPFSLALTRPNKFRLHSLQATVVSDGQFLHASIYSLEDQVLVQPCPKKLTPDSMLPDKMLVEAARGVLDFQMPQTVLLFDEKPIETLAGDGQPQLLEDAPFDRHDCHRVAIKGPKGRSVFWIDAENHILRKFEFAVEDFRQRQSLDRFAAWAEFSGARLGGEIDDKAFQFDAPTGAKLLKRFLPPAPDSPPQILDKPVADFVFSDLDGNPVTRDSLKGKVVVLDLWATWCGWCIKGFPNLEKVYERYKDNDQVVILAVSTDTPNVTNAVIHETMEKAGAHVPIVRDLKSQTETVFDARALPTMILLGADGTVQEVHLGYDENLQQTLPKKLDRLLAGENLAKEVLDQYDEVRKRYEQELADALADSSTPESTDSADKDQPE